MAFLKTKLKYTKKRKRERERGVKKMQSSLTFCD